RPPRPGAGSGGGVGAGPDEVRNVATGRVIRHRIAVQDVVHARQHFGEGVRVQLQPRLGAEHGARVGGGDRILFQVAANGEQAQARDGYGANEGHIRSHQKVRVTPVTKLFIIG